MAYGFPTPTRTGTSQGTMGLGGLPQVGQMPLAPQPTQQNMMGQQAWMGGAQGGPGGFRTGLPRTMGMNTMQNPSMSPMGGSGGMGGGFNTQYGTTGNLGPYGSGWAPTPYNYQQPGQFNLEADPGFIFARDQAMEAIQNSAAAHGTLGSTGTINDLASRLTGLGQQYANDAYSRYADQRNFGRSNFESDRGFGEQSTQNAFNRFGQDRNYMTDAYRDNRDFNYRGFRDQQGDYNQRMALQQMAESGLANNAQDWSRLAASMPAVFAQIIAQLYGDQGNAKAGGAINGANINGNLLQNMIGLGGMAYGG